MTTNNFFETKEQYLAFRKAWSNAVNDPRAKPRLEDDTDWDGTPNPSQSQRMVNWFPPHVIQHCTRS